MERSERGETREAREVRNDFALISSETRGGQHYIFDKTRGGSIEASVVEEPRAGLNPLNKSGTGCLSKCDVLNLMKKKFN